MKSNRGHKANSLGGRVAVSEDGGAGGDLLRGQDVLLQLWDCAAAFGVWMGSRMEWKGCQGTETPLDLEALDKEILLPSAQTASLSVAAILFPSCLLLSMESRISWTLLLVPGRSWGGIQGLAAPAG